MVRKIEAVNAGRPRVEPRLGRLFGLVGAAWILAAQPSCIINVYGDAGECDTDAECLARADGTDQCSAAKICISSPAAGGCSTNQQCLDKDPNTICRKSDNTCVPLRTTECQTVDGDPARDDSLMIGAVLPTTGVDESFGKPIELAIQLALSEIQTESSGLPTSPPGVSRPILFIGCSGDSNSEDTAIKAVVHLSEVLQVPAIIGEAFSGLTLAIANNVTIKNGTLLISPSATNDAITSMIDKGLVWRTSPPDSLQSVAIKLYAPEVEAIVRANFVMNNMPPDTPVKVAVIQTVDPYGAALADGLLASADAPALQINGAAVNDPSNMASYVRMQYSSESVDEQAMVVKEMASVFHPDILLLFGFTEAIAMMGSIEADWTGSPARRPRYVFSDAALSSELSSAVGTNNDLRARVTGTLPKTTNERFAGFVERYNLKYTSESAKYSASTFGAAGGYDAVFLLAYASATLNGQPETGANLAMGMKKLSDQAGLLVNTGATSISAGFDELMTNGTIDYNGASGPLNFDPATGEAPSDIQIWCLPVAPDGTGAATDSGRFYDAASAQLAGTFTACN